MSRQSIEKLRILILITMFTMLLLVENGRGLYYISTIGICLNLLLHTFQRPAFFRLIMVWQVGFILFIGLDGLLDYQAIIYEVQESAVQIASKYLNLANAAVLLGHALIFRERGFRQVPWYVTARLSSSPWLPWFLVLLYIIFLSQIAPFALAVATQGRQFVLGGEGLVVRNIDDAIFYNLAIVIGIMLPTLIAYYLLWIKRKYLVLKPGLVELGPVSLSFILSMPIFVMQVFTGNRFPLLLATIGLFVLIYARNPFNLKTLKRLLMSLAVLFLLTVFMYQFRASGVDSFEFENVVDSLEFRSVVTSEGVVKFMARMVDYFPYHGYEYGSVHGAMLLFWIPRTLWEDKPTQLGYWFPRSYGLTGFSGQHSIAASFADLAYADFGFIGGILLMLLGGIGLGFIERWSAKIISLQGHPYIVIVAVLYGLIFFAVRQVSTVYILLLGALALNYVFLGLLNLRRVYSVKGKKLKKLNLISKIILLK